MVQFVLASLLILLLFELPYAEARIAANRSTGKILPTNDSSRRLSAQKGQLAPTGKAPCVELDALNLKDLDVPIIELKLVLQDKSPRVFDGIKFDQESWYGEERGGQGFLHLVLRAGSDHLSGFLQDQYKSYGIWSRSDGTVFATVEQDFTVADNKGLPKRGRAKGVKGVSSPAPSKRRRLKMKKSKNTRVDMMVLYTKRAMCGHAGLEFPCEESKENREAIEAEAKINVAISNVAFHQSGIEVDLKLVHLAMDEEVDIYPTEVDTTDLTDDAVRDILENGVNDLINDRLDIHALRDKHGADVVAYIIDKNYIDFPDSNGALAGDVFRLPSATLPSQFANGPRDAYFVLNRNARFHFVFTHELGHLFGVDHSNSFCNTETNNVTDENFVGPCFKTVMVSRGDDDCTCSDPDNGDALVAETEIVPRIHLFSSANLEYSGHSIPARSGFDAVDIINANACTVADFRDRRSKSIPLVFGSLALVSAIAAGALVKKKIISCDTCATETCKKSTGTSKEASPYMKDYGFSSNGPKEHAPAKLKLKLVKQTDGKIVQMREPIHE